ncbi:glycosyl transferase [Aureibaculum marinum]|uniref:Glycosyl transferase n=1 Tax=Aureibaculum marinum TaxID=2487930 RepID=A0A3N4NQ54_9FLAO|nr:glycosyltransferase family protein [Aureibaculum marinum]RPD96648.1 glycosyl transferase [Aureibaculum marinum]
MKILYAIQGTGNGHLTRATEIIPTLLNRAQVDILISGKQSEVPFPYEVKYDFKGIPFVFGKKGGIDYWKTFTSNNLFRIIKEIYKCKVKDYDLVINDFEPISAWACFLKGKKCISLSHQNALLSNKVPKPKTKSRIGNFILRNYAPASEKYGFHFKSYDNSIFPAIIRKEIREQTIKEKNYYTVYLPSYSDKRIIKVLSKIKSTKWKVFSKNCKKAYSYENITIKPIDNKKFQRSMAHCKGIICGAGFETPAEALFLKKKLLVIPMKGQYEQACNAVSLKKLGVTVINKLDKKHLFDIKQWLYSNKIVSISFPDQNQFIIDKILTNYIIITELSQEIIENIS